MEKDYRLPKEFTEKWIQALRSGKYKQGVGHLCHDGRYCCLGVACEVAGVSDFKGEEEWIFEVEADTKGIPEELTGDSELPEKLACLNDKDKYTFNQIADFLEQNVELI